MKFFIDTANIKEIREAAATGILDGVTTNPSLISKEEGTLEEILLRVCHEVQGPVSAEVISTDSEGMVEEGRRLAKIHDRIVVKVPVSWDGLKAVRSLTADGIRVNVTLVFSATQALLIAKAGAAYVSPFVGRLDDVGHDGLDVVRQTVAIYDNYHFETEIIVASVRSPMHVIEAALCGADITTLPYSVLQQLVKHPLTDVGLERFLKDWRNWKEKQSG